MASAETQKTVKSTEETCVFKKLEILLLKEKFRAGTEEKEGRTC